MVEVFKTNVILAAEVLRINCFTENFPAKYNC